VRNDAKLWSRDRMYFKLFSQASMEVIVSVVVRDHCFGARTAVILFVESLTGKSIR
jgi:hypothetical protein